MGFGLLSESDSPLRHFGFIAALPQEARVLSSRLSAMGSSTTLGLGCRLVVSGMGPLRARRAAERLLDEGVLGLVSWGTCGGLAPGLPIGTLVLADTVLGPDGMRLPVAYLPALFLADIKPGMVRRGPLLSVSEAVTTVAEKARYYQATGALGVDMESAELAQVAKERGVDLYVIRSIVDAAEEALPSFLVEAIDEVGRLRIGTLLAGLGFNPRKWAALWRLHKSFGRARGMLARVAAGLGLRP